MSILHILFSACKVLGLSFHSHPFFKLMTSTELLPMFFDLTSTLLRLFFFALDEGKFLLCLLQFCIHFSQLNAILPGRRTIFQSVSVHFLYFFKRSNLMR